MRPELSAPEGLDLAVRGHERLLWALCYRMTGVAADADELVQETWLRCLERPPADRDRPLRPWLTRVALNLSRDHLRHRKSRAYVGPWLPSPVPLEDTLPAPEHSPEDQLALRQSASMGTLLALEALTPAQRAVWLLRDVFEHSTAETAAVLRVSEGAVKVSLHRARKELARMVPGGGAWDEAGYEAATEALVGFFAALQTGDEDRAREALDEAAVLCSDGGGEFHAAKVPILGAERITRFYAALLRTQGLPEAVELLELNGGPALRARFNPRPGLAPEVVVMPELGSSGRIVALYAVLATPKRSGLPA